ncbi:MAG: thiamine-phosphate kinase [Pseudomonadales bacterium]
MTFSEFDIIDRYFAPLSTGTGNGVVLGGGDDCAILDVPDGYELCVSTDTLLTGVHFPRDAPAHVAAHRGLAANASDLAAMGAKPTGYILALTLVDADESWLQPFSATLETLAARWQIPLIGGNLTRGSELSLTFTVTGITPSGMALRRSGARHGDDIYVTGWLGEAGAGLQLVQRDPTAGGSLVDRYLCPEPRLELGQALRGLASAGIDLSDGIASDLQHILKASGVSASVDLAALPVSKDLLKFSGQTEARRLALSAGDDYELCFTAPPDRRKDIEALASAHDIEITCIGRIEAGPGGPEFIDENGNSVSISAQGYRHF